MTKKGSRMAFARVEDLTGSIELVFFPEAFERSQEILKRASVEAEPLIIQGEIEGSAEGAKMLVKSIEWLEDAHKNRVQQVVLKIPMDKASPEQLRELKKSIIQFRGKCPIRIEFQD